MNKILALLAHLQEASPPLKGRYHAVMLHPDGPVVMVHIGERWIDVPLDVETLEEKPTVAFATAVLAVARATIVERIALLEKHAAIL